MYISRYLFICYLMKIDDFNTSRGESETGLSASLLTYIYKLKTFLALTHRHKLGLVIINTRELVTLDKSRFTFKCSTNYYHNWKIIWFKASVNAFIKIMFCWNWMCVHFTWRILIYFLTNKQHPQLNVEIIILSISLGFSAQ